MATSRAQANPGPAVYLVQRALTSIEKRSVGLAALVGVTVPSFAVVGFWLLAARWYEPAAFAAAFALVSVIIMLGELARIGLAQSLVRFLPRSGSPTGALLARTHASVAVVGGVGALIFVLGLDIWAPGLQSVRSSVALAVFVVVATVAWGGYLLTEASLKTIFDDQDWLWLTRAGIASVRIGLVLILASVGDGADEVGVVVSWAVPVLMAVVAVNLWAGRRLRPASSQADTEVVAGPVSQRRLRTVGRMDWLSEAARVVTVGGLALLALGRLEAPVAAHYFLAWLLVHTATVAVDEIIEVLNGDWLRSDQADDPSLTKALGLNALIAALVFVILLGVIEMATRLLGPTYDGVTGPARLLALTVIPSAVVTTLRLRSRAEDRLFAIAVGRLVMAFLVIVLAAVLVGPWGIYGLVAAWLVVSGLAALGCLAALTVWWWGPRLSGRAAGIIERMAKLASAVRALSERSELNRQVSKNLDRLYQTKPDWWREMATPIHQTLVVAGHDGRPPLRIELARTEAGADQLTRRRAAVSEVNGLAPLGRLRNLVPYPIDYSDEVTGPYLVESVVSGQAGDSVVAAALLRRRVESVADAVVELHHETAFTLAVDEDVFDHWVTKPLRRLGDSVRISDADLASVERVMFEGLNGLTLSAARIHGCLRLDQALFEADGDRLTGLINWEWSEPGPVALDWGVLALSAIMLEEQRDLGPVVSDLLDEPAQLRLHPAFVSAVGDSVPPRVLVLMAWLQYTRPVVIDSGARGLSRYWEARNVRPILTRLQSGLGI